MAVDSFNTRTGAVVSVGTDYGWTVSGNNTNFALSGNVGIGTTSPGTKLAVNGGINNGVSVTDGTVTGIMFASGVMTNSLAVGTTSNHPLAFGTNNDFSRLAITSGGNIGIGTTTPATAIQVLKAPDNNNGILRLGSTGNNAGLTFWTGGGSTMRNWQISSNYSSAGGLSVLRSTTNTGDPTTSVMEFDASGNVGLGTTSPSQILHIQKNTTASLVGEIENQNSAGNATWYAANNLGHQAQIGIHGSTRTAFGVIDADNGYFYSSASVAIASDNASGVIKFATGGSTEKIRFDSAGNVGVGTTAPVTGVHVRKAPDNNNGIFRLETTGNNAGLTFWTSGDSSMRNWQLSNNYQSAGGLSVMRSTSNTGNPTTSTVEITAAGNVGIGTTTPASGARVDVQGGGLKIGPIVNPTLLGPTPGFTLPDGGDRNAALSIAEFTAEMAGSGGSAFKGVLTMRKQDAGSAVTGATLSVDNAGEPIGVLGVLANESNTASGVCVWGLLRGNQPGNGQDGVRAWNGASYSARYGVQISYEPYDGAPTGTLGFPWSTALRINGAVNYLIDCHSLNVGGTQLFYVDASGNEAAVSNNTISDIRTKTDVAPLVGSALDVIARLRPSTFLSKLDGSGRKRTGYVAQEVEPLIPSAVASGEDGLKSIETSAIVAYLVKAVQELAARQAAPA